MSRWKRLNIGMARVTAFRLAGHGLGVRGADVVEAAGRCGVQNAPQGAAGLALNARVDDATGTEAAIERDRTLLQAFSLRAAPHVFPAADAGVVTLGLLPDGEEELRDYLPGALQALDKVRLSATDAVELAAAALLEVLDGRAMTKNDLGRELGGALTDRLPGHADRKAWRSASWYASGQFLGESIVRFVLPVLSLKGLLWHGGREGRSPLLRRTGQWLGREVGRPVRGELMRRYLRCYGPSNAEEYAEWGGIGRARARREFAAEELVEAEGGRWIHAADADFFAFPPRPEGVRFLPPHDPYLQTRDRGRLVSDRAWRREIWRSSGNPGVVLSDGEIVATWRPKSTGERLDLTLRVRGTLPPRPAHAEAVRLAAQRGRALGRITWN
ncbi:crosslink repair DNA glycosylase YcaQ family protein [Nonomuraea sp. NPDC046570]|uniref:DNA glycosylase AlkZ-like family protein n=1 Tax=Nonomuraea sp. NPDC046570 TaxID=3155255 RepID=UPI0033FEA873